MTDQERDELIERVSRATDVPEPSPLFWEHFQDRVRAAVHAEPVLSPSAWWRRRAVVLTVSMTTVAALATAVYVRTGTDAGGSRPTVVAEQSESSYDFDSMDADAGWAVVSDVAASAGAEMLRDAGFGVAPGAAEPAIEALNERERLELMALLQAEMKGAD